MPLAGVHKARFGYAKPARRVLKPRVVEKGFRKPCFGTESPPSVLCYYYYYNPSYIVIQPGMASAVLRTAGPYSHHTQARVRDQTAPNYVLISFTILFLDQKALHNTGFVSLHVSLAIRTSHLPSHINTKHIVSQNISLTNTSKLQTYCQSEHLTYQHI